MSAPAGARILPPTREHAAALHILAAPSIRDRAARFVDDAGAVDWLRQELAAGQWSWDQWLLVCAAHDLDGTASAALRRLCTTLAPPALRRVVEAVLLLRPDAAHKPGGEGVR